MKHTRHFDLYASELCDFQEARSSLGEQEQTFLCHRNYSHTTRGLDAGRLLVHALVVVQVVYDLGGQVDILRLGFRLLPKSVEDSEEFRVDLLLLTCNKDMSRKDAASEE